jgi:hypothetical protein
MMGVRGPIRCAGVFGIATVIAAAALAVCGASLRPHRATSPAILAGAPAPAVLLAGAEVSPGPRELPRGIVPRAVVRFEGTPRPGHRIRLVADEAGGADLHYRWTQTLGPRVALDDPSRPTTGLVVPEGAESLGFVLTVANAIGIDSAPVAIPIDAGAVAVAVAVAGAGGADLRADAGDDQIALVGRQVTLNGGRSEPRGLIGFRWVQVGGPKVRMKIEEGPIFTFIPTVPGVYRFALLVASGRAISAPDTVAVSASAATAASAAIEPRFEGPESAQDLARRVLASVKGGVESADVLAGTFEAIADRVDLYQSYAELFSEMSRRLETIVPAEPAWRSLWMDKVFAPLTARLIERMLAEGLDLRRPEGQAAELSPSQRAQIAEQFREIAEGFRATRPPAETTTERPARADQAAP